MLVLRGEPGVGKSVLLCYAVEEAEDMQVVRMVAVESEKTVGFAAVHKLLVPFLPAVDRLPEPQRAPPGTPCSRRWNPPPSPGGPRAPLSWMRSYGSRGSFP